MSGHQHDPIAEHAAAVELAHAVGEWRRAEELAAHLAARHLEHPGIRADTVAAAAGMSRATLYRWVSQHRATVKPTARKPKGSQGPAQPVPEGRRRRP